MHDFYGQKKKAIRKSSHENLLVHPVILTNRAVKVNRLTS